MTQSPTDKYSYEIVRSRRRTFSLLVDRHGRLVVRTPLKASLDEIHRLVEKHAGWIAKKQAQAQARAASLPPPKTFQPGERFLYLGQEYPLVIVPRQKEALLFDGRQFLLRSSGVPTNQTPEQIQPKAKQAFETWYKAAARQVCTERANFYAAQFGLSFTSLRISSAKTRWGSCGRGSLNFTWRLVMAPLPVLDSVVIHELAHLVHRNHSPAFWAQVHAWMPDYPQHHAWLKKNSARLVL